MMKSLHITVFSVVTVFLFAFTGLWYSCGGKSQTNSKENEPTKTNNITINKGNNSTISINEAEQIFVDLNDASNKMTLEQRIGIGINDERKEKYTIPVVLKDRVPSDFRVISPKEGTGKVQTIYSKPIAQTFSIEKTNNSQILRFDLKDVPAVDPDAESGCCACNSECGGACSVELSYKASGNLKQQWAKINYIGEPKVLKFGEKNIVVVTVNVENRSLQKPVLVIRVPRRIRETQIDIASIPSGFTKREDLRQTILEANIINTQKQIAVPLLITPMQKGQLTFPDSIEIDGSLKGLAYPMVEVVSGRKIQRISSSNVSYHGSLYFKVK